MHQLKNRLKNIEARETQRQYILLDLFPPNHFKLLPYHS